MDNNLIRIEENTLIVADKVITAIKNLEKEKKELEKQEKELRDKLLSVMEQYGKDKWVSPDESLKISYTPENEAMIFDSKKFQEEEPELYYKYLKPSKRKASIRMTIKDED